MVMTGRAEIMGCSGNPLKLTAVCVCRGEGGADTGAMYGDSDTEEAGGGAINPAGVTD